MSSSDSDPDGGYGNLLRTLRLRAGMSQEDLAKRSGISQRGLRNIEAQSAQLRPGTVRLLAEALELTGEQRDAFISAALDRLLRSLGADSEQIPNDLDARAALYRSLLAGRRMVVVLDNAASESQVGPLLPGDPGNLVLVTSRNKLPGLDDASYLSLETLAETDAADLFHRVADLDADSAAVAQIVERCGRLPLAIRIAASRLSNRPRRSITPPPHWRPTNPSAWRTPARYDDSSTTSSVHA